MRACEGCRRRKIKCDAATTNAWPCAACIRLKLNCVPPTVSYDKDFNGSQTFELELEPKPLDYASDPPSQHDYQRHAVMPHDMPHQMGPALPSPASAMYQSSPYVDHHQSQPPVHYQSMSQPQVVSQNMTYAPQQPYAQTTAPPPAMTMTPPESEPNWRSDSAASLSDALGELKIDYTAIGESSFARASPPTSWLLTTASTIHYKHEKDIGRDAGAGGVRGPATTIC